MPNYAGSSASFGNDFVTIVTNAAQGRGWPKFDWRAHSPDLFPDVIGPGQSSWSAWIATADPNVLREMATILDTGNGSLVQ